MGNEYAGFSMDLITTILLAVLIFLIAILALVALFVVVVALFAGVGMIYDKLLKFERFKKIRQDKW